MTEDTTRIEKIQKLLAKAERAGTPEEAEAFAEKAQELMTKWAIDEAVLRSHGEKRGRIVTKTIKLNKSNRHADVYLANGIGEANDLYVVHVTSEWNPRVMVTGFEEDVEAFEITFASLLIQVQRAQREAVKTQWHDWQMPKSRFVRSFRIGFAVEVQTRLLASRQKVVDTYEGDDLLPVLAAKADQIQEAVDAEYGDSLVEARGSRINSAAAESGRAAGARADVGFSRVAGARGELT